jgi:DnaJ-class molecular chaperone
VTCPQCDGENDECEYCDGSGYITLEKYIKWERVDRVDHE